MQVSYLIIIGIIGILFSGMNYAHAANANLFVSAENSQFDNYMSGPQVIEVVVIDSDINDTDEAKGEPDVTVNGKDLRMVQGVDGNWYGYFADRNMTQIADSTTTAVGKGLDFGTFCGAGSTLLNGGQTVTFTDTVGIAVNSAQGINGTNPATTTIPNCITAFVADGSLNVLREAKQINTNSPGATKNGQIGLSTAAGAWPFIQLYALNPTGNVVIQYNKGGGAQTTTLTFDSVDQFAGIELDKPLYKQGIDVLATITDPWLNIDPTDEDSWTFGTFGITSSNYQVFDENGNSAGDVASNAGSENALTASLPDLMCEDNCVMTVNPDIQGSGFVITLQDNEDSRLSNVDGDSNSIIDPQNPLDWATSGGNMNGTIPITITEGGPNSGVFTSFDELIQSSIKITNNATVNSDASVSYTNSVTFVASSTDHLVIFENGSSSSSCNPCISPASLTILQNQNITWFNSDIATHTVKSGNPADGPDGIFDSGFISPGESFSFTFASPGSFDYYDIIHPWITGVVNVTDLIPPPDADIVISLGGHDIDCQSTLDCFEPQSLSVSAGTQVKWFNSDVIDHRITSGTSGISDGKFSSGTISPGQHFEYTFNEVGTFPYFDPLHSWAIGEVVTSPVFPPGVDIIIAPGSSSTGCENTNSCFIPSIFSAEFGTTITWNNTDNAAHTITSGTPGDGPDGNFDSGLVFPNEEFSHLFNQDGMFPYYDVLHPWMTGSITINPQACVLSPSGIWIITENCKLETNSIAPANVRIQNNSTLTIQNGVTLTIPSGNNVTVEFGSGVLIKSGGALKILS